MEEILASIRRIINENDDQPGGETESEETSPVIADDDVLELTEIVKEDGSVVSLAPAKDEQQSDEAAGEGAFEGDEAGVPDSVAKAEALDKAKDESLVAKETAKAATGSFAELARVLAEKREGAGDVDSASGGASEELVNEMVRPMLKDWLDQNLPDLVERLVRKELARMVRRAEDQ